MARKIATQHNGFGSRAAYGRTSSITSQKTGIDLAAVLADCSSEALDRTWHQSATQRYSLPHPWPWTTGDEAREHERDPVKRRALTGLPYATAARWHILRFFAPSQ
jgi:hypothetical protein